MLLSLATRSRLLSAQKAAAVMVARKYAKDKAFRCDAHMNELPIPCGPWGPHYKERQSFYNKILLFGVLWWGFSAYMLVSTGSFYMNWGPPLVPAPPLDMVKVCEDD